ncbi:MAG: hypothetical protein ACFFCZ_19865 [Promethearchaeota archaeon]
MVGIKSIEIAGIVNGEILYGKGDEGTTTIFSLELIKGINSTFKIGTSLVVYYRGTCYARQGDQIKIFGHIERTKLSDGSESIHIKARKMYNETLQFSLNW